MWVNSVAYSQFTGQIENLQLINIVAYRSLIDLQSSLNKLYLLWARFVLFMFICFCFKSFSKQQFALKSIKSNKGLVSAS